ncbi:MAG: nucleoside triphosphate pyrophosphohydrolase [Pseudomonadota bacterium]
MPGSGSVAPIFDLIDVLRGEDGCSWDRKQTARSMAVYLAEEVFELAEAITAGDPAAVCEEFGDVLFLLLFICRCYTKEGRFTFDEAVARNVEKMTRRHPHVFGDSHAETPDAVRRQWNEIKKEEKAGVAEASILDAIPSGLPALLRAYRVSRRAGEAGFDWDDIGGVMAKVDEEWGEFKDEANRLADGAERPAHLAMEFGDILFTLVNVARFAGFHPESAVAASTAKFEKRFRFMERRLQENGDTLGTVPRERLEALWETAKREVAVDGD